MKDLDFSQGTPGSNEAVTAANARVFVAGASGYTGRALVATLANLGATTYAHIRPESRSLTALSMQFASEGARVDTTPWEASAMQARMAELAPHVVYCLVGTTKATARAERAARGGTVDYETVDYGLTALLVSACVRSGRRPRFVYLSSAGVTPRASGAYLRARWKAEEAVRHSNLPYTIVRPSFITGEDRPESRPLERGLAVVSDGLLRGIGALGATRLRDRYLAIRGPALAKELVRLAFEETAANRVVEADELGR